MRWGEYTYQDGRGILGGFFPDCNTGNDTAVPHERGTRREVWVLITVCSRRPWA